MTLGIQINPIHPGSWGFTTVGEWPHPVNTHLGVADECTYLLWTLDATTLQGTNQFGRSPNTPAADREASEL